MNNGQVMLVKHIFRTVYDVLLIITRTVYVMQCMSYSVRRTVYVVQCTSYSVRRTVYVVQCTLYNVRCIV